MEFALNLVNMWKSINKSSEKFHQVEFSSELLAHKIGPWTNEFNAHKSGDNFRPEFEEKTSSVIQCRIYRKNVTKKLTLSLSLLPKSPTLIRIETVAIVNARLNSGLCWHFPGIKTAPFLFIRTTSTHWTSTCGSTRSPCPAEATGSSRWLALTL